MLGFEYGFSLGIAGSGLVAWEAQFGDFANNAQAMVDQFVSAGRSNCCCTQCFAGVSAEQGLQPGFALPSYSLMEKVKPPLNPSPVTAIVCSYFG